jgi:hypothetical protein
MTQTITTHQVAAWLGGPRRNPAENLTQDQRRKGGKTSAQRQTRNASGRFSGKKAMVTP